MYKLIKLYFSNATHPLKNLCLMIFILMMAFNSQSTIASTSVAKPVAIPLTASPNSSQANTSSPTQLQISDLAKIQQQILHQEFLKKLALTTAQQLPVTVASNIQNKPTPIPLAPEKNQLTSPVKKPVTTQAAQHQFQVLAIYGSIQQPTAEIILNGQHYFLSEPLTMGIFQILSIQPHKILLQLHSQNALASHSVKTTHQAKALFELVPGQQLEVLP